MNYINKMELINTLKNKNSNDEFAFYPSSQAEGSEEKSIEICDENNSKTSQGSTLINELKSEGMDKVKLAYIIDDDDVIIYLTGKILEQEAFCERSKTFTDAEVALSDLKRALTENVDVPDVILFDLNMPGMDGWMFIDEFKKLNCNIPTFIFTSSIDPMDKQKSFRYREIKDFITKPLTKNSLNKIKRLIS